MSYGQRCIEREVRATRIYSHLGTVTHIVSQLLLYEQIAKRLNGLYQVFTIIDTIPWVH